MKKTFGTMAATGLLVAALSACSLPTIGAAAAAAELNAVDTSRQVSSGSQPAVLNITHPQAGGVDPIDRVLADAAFLEGALNDYWTRNLAATYGLQFDTPDDFVPYQGSGNPPCGGTQTDESGNAYYCPVDGDEYVAFDVDLMVSMLNQAPGDAFTFLVLSHEWGHAVQDTWQEQEPGRDIWQGPAQELNADCLAGVFLTAAVNEGTIVVEEGDAEALWEFLYQIGDPADVSWTDPGAHGSPAQRQQAFADGASTDVTFCRTNY